MPRPGSKQLEALKQFGPMKISDTVEWKPGDWHWLKGKPWQEMRSCERHGWLDIEQAPDPSSRSQQWRARTTEQGLVALAIH